MKKKIINDPIYGLISINNALILKIIDHPYFQRLRRIRQMALAEYVFPCATHNRFQHSLGSYYLMSKTIEELKEKKIPISDEEKQAAQIAALLHDIGHGPFSHSLEQKFLTTLNHEQISQKIIDLLNQEIDGNWVGVKKIMDKTYQRKFFSQLFSGQLDVDRMDYLTRDSYFTGVAEGIIGYDRLLKMINVFDNELVIEEKGIHSVENFLIARNLMYSQVYLHKTVWCIEELLTKFVERLQLLINQKMITTTKDEYLDYFFHENNSEDSTKHIEMFMQLDDMNILQCIKANVKSDDKILSIICNSIINRKLFKVKRFKTEEEQEAFERDIFQKLQNHLKLPDGDIRFLFFSSIRHCYFYMSGNEPIHILTKNQKLCSLSDYYKAAFFFRQNIKMDFIYTGYYLTK